MSRFLGLALLILGLGGCSSTILLGNPYPDAGGADARSVPTVELLPNPLDFGSISINAGSSRQSPALFNPGKVAALVKLFPPDAGPFSGDMTTRLVAPQKAANPPFTIFFAPNHVGPLQGRLDYIVCAGSDPDGGAAPCSAIQSVRLQGKGF